jgi:hypothetical protein
MAAVRDHGRPRVDHLARLGVPAAVGLDETSFLAATAERPTLLVTGVIDIDRGVSSMFCLLAALPQSPTGWRPSRRRGWRGAAMWSSNSSALSN